MAEIHTYDIFISYAREDSEWVIKNLHEPLLQCRTADNRRPRIYLDLSEEGTKQGRSFIDEMADALLRSHKIIPVYSKKYFLKEMTEWELKKSWQLDPTGKLGKVNPILIDPEGEKFIPFIVNDIQYLDIFCIVDWFTRLIKNLGLTVPTKLKPAKIVFKNKITDIAVNHTLPSLEITIEDEDGVVKCEENISISSEQGELQGTLIVKSDKGKAIFADLLFGDVVNSTRLVAASEGYESGFSTPFAVFTPPPVHPIIKADVQQEEEDFIDIPRTGLETIFFKNGKALAIFDSDGIAIFNTAGNLLCEIPFPGRIRFIKGKGSLLAAADWSGNVVVIYDDGRYYHHALGNQNWEFNVIGDMAFNDEILYVGFWSGVIFKLTPSNAPVIEISHNEGIQGFAVLCEQLYVCDLKGNLCIYQEEKLVGKHKLAPPLFLIKAFEDSVIAIGEKKVYQLKINRSNVIDEEHQLSGVSGVLGDADIIFVVDVKGKGLRYDKNLDVRSRFHTKPGAVPISADNAGKICIFRYPDGARVLLLNDKIVYSHLSGVFSISPKSDYFVVGDKTGTKLYESKFLPKLYERNL
jgi:hypothetical protein